MTKRTGHKTTAARAARQRSSENDSPVLTAVALPAREPTAAAWVTILAFAPVIFLGAFLLFGVQPLIARFLLPWFGGTPAVWTTCLLFFQALLLVGYAYAHLSVTYLPHRGQVILHLALLIVALVTAPIIPPGHWKPTPDSNPVAQIILILLATVGLPYAVLAGTSPLLQAWFLKASGGHSPYRLFALSNLGSLLALLAYPFVFEPNLTRVTQAHLWRFALVAFAIFCTICGALVWSGSRDNGEASGPGDLGDSPKSNSSWPSVILWLALPCIASVLLLAITNTLCQDIAAVPLLWVVPLSIYLITFIIAFDSPRWYRREIVAMLLPLCILWVLRLNSIGVLGNLAEQLLGYSFALFVGCLFCHGELALLKPHPRRLTSYYLLIALGGAVGGLLVAVVAPYAFNRFFEMPLGFLACALLAVICYLRRPLNTRPMWVYATPAAGLLLVAAAMLQKSSEQSNVIARMRNFYGVLSVVENTPDDPKDLVRSLVHGRIRHGSQYQDFAMRRKTSPYYSDGSGIELAFENITKPNRRVGIIGLGAGELAAYAKPGDHFRFYEINADVETLARRYFTFLADSPATIDVILGDGRLSLEREPPQKFDLLVLDAFTGDAVPAHLLTKEAFDIYLRHLDDEGVLAVHITNGYIDLYPVIIRIAEHYRFFAPAFITLNSKWVLLTHSKSFVLRPQIRETMRARIFDDKVKMWTDDHINLLRILKFFKRD